MSGVELLQSVQFATVNGKRVAVIDGNDWEALIEWLETLDDIQVARDTYARLAEAGGDRKKAGWLSWDDVEGELE